MCGIYKIVENFDLLNLHFQLDDGPFFPEKNRFILGALGRSF